MSCSAKAVASYPQPCLTRLNDEVFDDIIAFLDSADQVGKNIGTTINVVEATNMHAHCRSVEGSGFRAPA